MHKLRIRIDTDFHGKNTDSPMKLWRVCKFSIRSIIGICINLLFVDQSMNYK